MIEHGARKPPAASRPLMYIIECDEGVSLDDLGFIDEAVGTPKGELIMTLAEKLRQEGREVGREEGRKEGQQKLLLKQLRLRFGELPRSVEDRIFQAHPRDLESMAERVLTASCLDEVLER